jgi:nucleotide-binding universal stress UspA family protein
MPKPILVGYDPGAGDLAPVHFGAAASRFTGAPLIVVAVRAGGSGLGATGGGIVEEHLGDSGDDALDHIASELRSQGVTAECRVLPGTSAPRALHEAADEFDAGLLVVGSSEHGAHGRLRPGSTAQRLMHGAPCPIAVVPRAWEAGGGLRTVGVAYVDTPEGHHALDGAVALARRSGAKLRVLSAGKDEGLSGTYGGGDPLTPATTYGELASTASNAAERTVAEATAGISGIDIDLDASVGDPGDFLVAASERLDLLVCGSRGYGPARAVLLGGVSRRLVSEAHCPVIVLARGAGSGLEPLIDEQATTST